MSHLVLCPACKRHLRPSEAECPFCNAIVPEDVRNAAPPPLPPSGLSRARAYAFRAAIIASVAGVACGSDDESTGSDGGGATAGSTSSGGSAGSSSGGTGATGGSAGDDAGTTGGTGGTATGGTGGGTGGFSGTPPMPYGCVWPDPEATVRV